MPWIGGTSIGEGRIVDDGVEQRLHALVLERRAAQHRHQLVGERALADAALERLRVRLLAAQVALERVVVELDRGLDQGMRGTPRPAPRARPGSRRYSNSAPSVSSFQMHRLLADQVDVADVVGLGADRQGQHQRRRAQAARGSSSTQRKKSAPIRSILLTKQIRGTRYLSAWRQTVSDCGSTPATESNTAIAPSSTRSERSTSIVKSTWPGVSMMLIRWSFQVAGGRGRGDRDAALLLLLHPVHRRGALVHLADLVRSCRCSRGCARSSWSCRHRCAP